MGGTGRPRDGVCGIPLRVLSGVLAVTIVIVSAVLVTPTARAQTSSLLYSFQCGTDGAFPFAGLVRDGAGNLYGTTSRGGTYGYGTVFKLTTANKESVLHSFPSNPTDGYYPTTDLVLDGAGNLYGATQYGGVYGGGTVFEISATTGVETILYNFTGGADGGNPNSLARNATGHFAGTTYSGGSFGYGTVFTLSPTNTETLLHSFNNTTTDGAYPFGGVVPDPSGNFYGTTNLGGTLGDGVVYKVTPTGAETLLHSFTGSPSDGSGPTTALVRDTAGNLYGSTSFGGASGKGTVFTVSGSGTESLLHDFAGHLTDGSDPVAGLRADTAGNLYGTTLLGGSTGCGGSGCGVVFKLTTAGQETVLHDFGAPPADGYFSYGTLALDNLGNLYGTTYIGAADRCGAVFKTTP